MMLPVIGDNVERRRAGRPFAEPVHAAPPRPAKRTAETGEVGARFARGP
jgi:hypothetical protein